MSLLFKKKNTRYDFKDWLEEENRQIKEVRSLCKGKSVKELAAMYVDMEEGKTSDVLAKANAHISTKKRLMSHIKNQIGQKAIYRYKLMDIKGYSEQEFEDYWQSLFLP